MVFNICKPFQKKVDLTFELTQFELYYNRLKKFTILRDFVRSGIDIKQFYNPDADFMHIDEENEKLNSIDISEIFDTVRQKIAVVEDKNISKANLKAIHAGIGLKDLVEELSKKSLKLVIHLMATY